MAQLRQLPGVALTAHEGPKEVHARYAGEFPDEPGHVHVPLLEGLGDPLQVPGGIPVEVEALFQVY